MDMASLTADRRNSIDLVIAETISAPKYSRAIRHLSKFRFWSRHKSRAIRPLWEHQVAAISVGVAYLCADARLKNEANAPESALLKLPTGTGKSGIVAVLARCLPNVSKVLVLTPRTALAAQLRDDVAWRFWQRLGFKCDIGETYIADPSTAGTRLPSSSVLQLLPSNAQQLVDELACVERATIVGTFQALEQIRAERDRSNRPVAAGQLLNLLSSFDAVIVDEAHYEPAPSWSRTIRALRLPTILLSATPYRNDYKSFRVRGRYVFNFPLTEARDRKIVRDVHFTANDHKGAATVGHFVAHLKEQWPSIRLSSENYAAHPKLIVRAGSYKVASVLQREIAREFGERPILIHHQVKGTDLKTRQFHSVRSAMSAAGAGEAQFWIHESKLLEGIDDASFVGVAIYDPFENARQLVQQIGRTIRTTDLTCRHLQKAHVLALPKVGANLQASWRRYEAYEQYAAEDPKRLVEAEGALPDRLLRELPAFQYFEGEFRPKFDSNEAIAADECRVPTSASIFEIESDTAVEELADAVEEALIAEDRFKPVRIARLPGNAIGFAYYAWRASPYLALRYFPEWTLGICVLVKSGSLLLVHDTAGVVLEADEFGLRRPESEVLQRLLPEETSTRAVRLNRMSTFSLDTSDRAIRSMSIRSRSIVDTVELLDPVLVPTTTSGYVQKKARYVGFTRSRLTDGAGVSVTLLQYCDWAEEIAKELQSQSAERNSVFGRYARIRGPLAADKAEAQSILLDLDGDLIAPINANDGDSPSRGAVDVEFDDLCSDVKAGAFRVTIRGKEHACEIEFDQRRQRYRIRSETLDDAYPGVANGSDREGQPLTAILNRQQAFRIIVAEKGVVYAAGKFYEPSLEYLRSDGSIPLLANVVSVPALKDVISEKGETFFRRKEKWAAESVFGIVHSICRADRHRPEWRGLYQPLRSFDIVICDDDGEEIGDFLAIDEERRRVAIIHAKVAKGSQMSSYTLQIVGRQALASLVFCSSVARTAKIKTNRWATNVNANGRRLALDRVFRNERRYSVADLESIADRVLADRSWNKEIWILAGNMLSRSAVEGTIRGGDPSNRDKQFLMHLESLVTGCARGNSTLRVFCSE